MKTYTLEIAGAPVAAIIAEGYDLAEALIKSEWFKDDLICLNRKETGQPVWDEVAPFTLRASTPEEATKARQTRDADDSATGAGEYVAFLVPVVDAMEDEAMPFIVLVGGTPTGAIMAEEIEDAQAIAGEQWFRTELASLLHEQTGRPLWDGITDLTVRPAEPAELTIIADVREEEELGEYFWLVPFKLADEVEGAA